MTSRLRGLCLAAALAALAGAGCSEKQVTVTGKLLKNGQPMTVSEDTYVTLSFIPEGGATKEGTASSHAARFDQKTGGYTVQLPPGKYKTMIVIANPNKKEGKVSGPRPPIRSDKVHELTKDQQLDIEVPG